MRFAISQQFRVGADQVARAYADPELYAALVGLPKLSQPDVVSHRIDGEVVELQVRYRFGGELSAAARAVIDPERLTWIERSIHDLASRRTTFTMLPDHYADRFRCTGSYQVEPTDTGCRRRGEGDLKVKALLVGAAVEGAIVSGLREHLVDEVAVVEAFVEARSR